VPNVEQHAKSRRQADMLFIRDVDIIYSCTMGNAIPALPEMDEMLM